MSRNQSAKGLQNAGWLLTLLSAAVLEAVRVQFNEYPLVSVIGTLLSITVAIGVGHWLARRRFERLPIWLVLAAAAFVFVPLGLELLLRTSLQMGQSSEIVQLLIVRNLMFAIAAVGQWRGSMRISCLLSLFLTIGGLSMTDSAVGFALSATYAVAGTWWLFGSSWQRLDLHTASETRREVPRAIAGTLAAVVLIVSLSGILLGDSRGATAIAGFFPSSGGTGDHDKFAMNGLNDGDALVGATTEAASFGPVESELFLDSDMPSLYDMFSDTYGEPLKPKQSERAVALSQPNTPDSHHKMATSQQSSREFSTLRKPNRRQHSHKNQRDLASTALLYVKGRVPLHLRLEAFDYFDGHMWRASDELLNDTKLVLDNSSGKPWIRVVGTSSGPTGIHTWPEDERHALRVINLKTAQVPSPVDLQGVHIDQVDQVDLFAVHGNGQVYMPDRESIPQLQVLHVQSHVSDPASLPPRGERELAAIKNMQPYLTLPQGLDVQKFEVLANGWVLGVARGWPQIEAVLERLREGHTLDASAMTPSTCTDPVSHFLFSNHRGPDYQFASAAVLLLRTLGYPARLVTGVYASPKDYDRKSKQTAVNGDDVHVWAEVCLDGKTWCTVEPSPGYDVLKPKQNLADLVSAVANEFRLWMLAHPWSAITAGLLAILAIALRRDLIESIYVCIWAICLLRSANAQVEATVLLLDRRAQLAGWARPARRTLSTWYHDVANRSDEQAWLRLQRFLSCATRYLYSPKRPERATDDASRVRSVCLAVAYYCTSRRFLRCAPRVKPNAASTRNGAAYDLANSQTTLT